MKNLLMFSAVLFISILCFATGGPVAQIRHLYNSGNVTTSAWTKLITTSNIVSSVEIFDSSAQTLELGVGPAGSEVAFKIIFPGGNGWGNLNIP